MRRTPLRAARLLSAVLLTLLFTACTGGVNAGEQGGRAFILFAGMLLAFLGILWFVLGRED